MSLWNLGDDLPYYHQLIHPIVQGHHVLAQGPFPLKRMYLLVSILQRINTAASSHTPSQCQALIISPTFELAWTVNSIARTLVSAMPSVKLYCCPRGFRDVHDRIAELQGSETGRVPDIVIGTPGLIWQCITSGWLQTDAVKMLVFEEMDEILDRGYDESVLLGILQTVAHGNTQVVVQSDSLHMWRRIWKLVSDFMPSPVRVWDI
ncbi:P-loop containing nucleoside triphosphate hydrolase protein [Aspergillus novoparasiticus]|uniref:ATP-dependent RNA helicase n=1 Tax=Aspergillus novoparasiticus TaxID=986946 RepID=A0A5N6EZP4_9EURO|nr:P-loop containing nucleoside triphosphate hydrolase protein [Aspergillus novoparasiticus]